MEKQIRINVTLDDKQVPEKITWEADDNSTGLMETKGLLLSFFDKASKETLKIDLWTKDMQVGEMDRLMFHTLRSLADTYYKATQNAQLAADLQRFVQYFGEKTEIIPKSENPTP